ncbi:MAG: hypothetical protein ACRBFS_15025 [Aureispira sp.]
MDNLPFVRVLLFWGSILLLTIFPEVLHAEAFKDSGLTSSTLKTVFFLALLLLFGIITGVIALFARLNKKIDPKAPSFSHYLPNILMLLLILLGLYFFLQIAP